VIEEPMLRNTPEELLHSISALLDSPERQAELGRKLHMFTHPNSAHELAELILAEAKSK
jgi:UDP-N-acetylglucosamine:LPS N-acetylglucosamine transferase